MNAPVIWNVVLPIGVAATLFVVLWFGLQLWDIACRLMTVLPG